MDLFDNRSVTFAEPLEMLYACHGKVKRFCGQLDMLPGYVAEHGFNLAAAQAVKQIMHYFGTAAPLHHQDEEEDFFPLLVKYAPQAAGTVAELESQHQTLHANWAALKSHLEALESGSAKKVEADTIRRFTLAYASHIALEEPLFEMGRRFVPDDQLAAAGGKMAARRRAG